MSGHGLCLPVAMSLTLCHGLSLCRGFCLCRGLCRYVSVSVAMWSLFLCRGLSVAMSWSLSLCLCLSVACTSFFCMAGAWTYIFMRAWCSRMFACHLCVQCIVVKFECNKKVHLKCPIRPWIPLRCFVFCTFAAKILGRKQAWFILCLFVYSLCCGMCLTSMDRDRSSTQHRIFGVLLYTCLR